MNLFLAESLTEQGGYLGKEESHHAHRVLRLTHGSILLTTLGTGKIYESEIIESTKSKVLFKNLRLYKSVAPPNRKLHIAIAPTKSNDRFEFFLEKACEIGIDTISPIICDHSERKVYKVDRGQKIISAAAKQSLACYWPTLNEPKSFSEFIEANTSENNLIAHCENDQVKSILPSLMQMNDVLMLIGPEGDFSKKEIEHALSKNFKECSLGSKRLRTETAGLAVALAFALE